MRRQVVAISCWCLPGPLDEGGMTSAELRCIAGKTVCKIAKESPEDVTGLFVGCVDVVCPHGGQEGCVCMFVCAD